MRRVLSEFFARPNEVFEKYFAKKSNIDPRIPPYDLLQELKGKKKMKSFIALMNDKEKNGLSVLKKLIVMHLCLIYSVDMCQQFKKIDMKQASESEWLDENVIKPYRLFLSKVCHSQQLYRAVQVSGVVQLSLQNLFFVIKLLKDLLQCRKKISSLHHYYKKESSTEYPFLIDNFVCILACHAQRIYSIFKAIMGEFIRYPKVFMSNPEVQRMMKFVMEVELVNINEEMRQLFLNSVYFPFGKGYGVKLFKIEDLPQETRDYAESILYPEKPKRRAKKITLDSILFDRTGKMNPQIYQGLQQITMGEDILHRQQQLHQLRSRLSIHSPPRRDYGQTIESV